MGQKVNPNGFRVGLNKSWDSQWFADKKVFGQNIKEDNSIRDFIKKNYKQCSISKILIDRTKGKATVTILTSRPGMLIGQKGVGVETLKSQLTKLTKNNITVNIREVKRPDIDALLVAENVASQLEKRISWRRAMKSVIQKGMKAGAQGIKVMVGGRLDGADIARSEYYIEGSLPLQTLRADIDYGTAEAHTTFGVIGVKVWVYKGEVLGKKNLNLNKDEEVKHNVDAKES